MKIASIVVASLVASVVDAHGAKTTKEAGEEVLSMSMAAASFEDLSMSVPLFEAEVSMSMPAEPIVAAKARKLYAFGRRVAEETTSAGSKASKTKKAGSGGEGEGTVGSMSLEQQEFLMSLPSAEEDLTMSVPLFEADIDLSMSMSGEPIVAAKARKLRTNNNFGRRYLGTVSRRTKAAKAPEPDEEASLSMLQFEADISMPLVDDLSMSVPLFEAEIDISLSLSMPEELAVGAKARKRL